MSLKKFEFIQRLLYALDEELESSPRTPRVRDSKLRAWELVLKNQQREWW